MTVDRPLRRSLLVAAAFLLLACALREFKLHDVVSPALAERLMGLMMGAVVVANANAAPKKLVPLDRLACDPAREQRLRRFAAWALVLGGLGWMLAYAFAPVDIAATLAIGLLAPPTVVVAGIAARCAWRRRAAR